MSDSEVVEEYSEKGRAGVRGRDWTKGSIIHNLLLISWPITISDGLRNIGPTIDLIWVGKLGSASIAGVGVASMAVFIAASGMMGINAGMRAMIARFVGAGNAEGANHVAQQAIVVSAAYGILMAVIGIFLAEPILVLLGLEAEVVVEGAAYMRIAFAGTAVMSFHRMSEGIMQASGDAVSPMRISVLYRAFHIILVPFLIFGWWIFPRWGVGGAALANVISQGLGMVVGLWVLFAGRSRLRLTLQNFRLDLKIIWRLVKIGVPASVMMAERSFGRLMLVWFMVPYGTNAVAAHTLIQRIVMFVNMISMGFGRGAGVLVGQNLGAQQPERAEKSAWLAVGASEIIVVACATGLILWPGSIVRIFNSDPALVELASVFIRIGGISYFAMSVDQVLMQCLSGAGDTLPPMLVTLLSTWAVTVPLALLLPNVADLGVYGVRWAMVAGIVSGAIVYVIYFRMGRWKRKRV
ncbi:MATE family efflux transporter [Chloroflexota bacterium]